LGQPRKNGPSSTPPTLKIGWRPISPPRQPRRPIRDRKCATIRRRLGAAAILIEPLSSRRVLKSRP
jgi:hypothetical protein